MAARCVCEYLLLHRQYFVPRERNSPARAAPRNRRTRELFFHGQYLGLTGYTILLSRSHIRQRREPEQLATEFHSGQRAKCFSNAPELAGLRVRQGAGAQEWTGRCWLCGEVRLHLGKRLQISRASNSYSAG